MAQGLSVTPSVLQAGSQNMAALQDSCLGVSAAVIGALNAMAAAAGHPGVTSALKGAAASSNRGYAGLWAGYGQAVEGLAGSAQAYSGADNGLAGQIGALLPGTFIGGPQP